MSLMITISFGYFVSELCPFDCFFYANFVYTNFVHAIT